VSKVGLGRFETVREALDDPETAAWLETLLSEEIVPVLDGRCEEPATFARQTLERFRNPFLRHKLSDIALHHATKKAVRLVPTREEYVVKFGRTPPMLDEVLAAPPPG
jgi:tagaturonate reductase